VVFHFEQHWQRLAESAQGLDFSLPFTQEQCRYWTLQMIQRSSWPDAILRLSVHWLNNGSGAIVFMLRPFKAYPAALYKKGVTLASAVPRRWSVKAQDSRLKASQYTNGVLAVLDNLGSDTRELIFLNQDGYVAEGSVSNIFIVKGKQLLTPCAASGILKGVTRDVVIALAKKRGLKVSETFLTRHEIYTAQECFMTNTSSEVLPVVRVDARTIGDGKPGPVARNLRNDFYRSLQKK
jgi:branched-chain amino acid aminotransferase